MARIDEMKEGKMAEKITVDKATYDELVEAAWQLRRLCFEEPIGSYVTDRIYDVIGLIHKLKAE